MNIAERLSQDSGQLLGRIGSAATKFGTEALLVGGVVRDIFLGGKLLDIDIVIHHNGIGFSSYLFDHWGTLFPGAPVPNKPVQFRHFGTAKLKFNSEILPGILGIDFSTARREHYPAPGERPEIHPGSVEEDLRRRDFSVNAIGVLLDEGQFGEVVDLFSGIQDIERRELNVLHEQSFYEDPARILRGVRLGARLGFSFGQQSAELIKQGAREKYLSYLPPNRLFSEFQKALSEQEVWNVLDSLAGYGFLEQVHPEFVRGLERVKVKNNLTLLLGAKRQSWQQVFCELVSHLSHSELGDLLNTLQIEKRVQAQLFHECIPGKE